MSAPSLGESKARLEGVYGNLGQWKVSPLPMTGVKLDDHSNPNRSVIQV